MPAGGHEHAGAGEPARARPAIEDRLEAIESSIADLKRRQVIVELRLDPGRLLSGVADTRRLVRQDLDDLADVLARWDVPLSLDEEDQLRRVALVAQGIAGARRSTVHLVVDVASQVSEPHLERVARAARVLAERSRRAIPVLVALEPPRHDASVAALALGVEVVLDT